MPDLSRRRFLAGGCSIALVATSAPLAARAPASMPTSMPADPFTATALDLLDRAERAFGAEASDAKMTMRETLAKPGPAFVWSMSMRLDAHVAAARADERRAPSVLAAIDDLTPYRDVIDGRALFRSQPGPDHGRGDAYFDDNAWIVLGLLEAHAITRDAAHLKLATEAFDSLAALAIDPAGGAWWTHERRETKNTCIVAPLALAAVRLGRDDVARSLVDWCDQHLRDSQDGLYFDHLRKDGSIDKTKFSYNAAVMALCHLQLDHADLARQTIDSGIAFWMRDASGKTTTMRDDATFARWWCEALIASGHPALARSVAARHLGDLKPNGWAAKKFDQPAVGSSSNPRLIDQMAFARLLLDVGHA